MLIWQNHICPESVFVGDIFRGCGQTQKSGITDADKERTCKKTHFCDFYHIFLCLYPLGFVISMVLMRYWDYGKPGVEMQRWF